MWKRFSAARNTFDRRRRAHFAKLAAEQDEAKATKEALVAEAEAARAPRPTGRPRPRMRELMDRWKAAGRAGRADDDALWQRFRSAQDTFFTARSAAFAERDAGQADNLVAKEALATEAEALAAGRRPGDARRPPCATSRSAGRRSVTSRAPTRSGSRAGCGGSSRPIREAEESKWKRSNPEARARAEATVEQLDPAITKLEKTQADGRRRPVTPRRSPTADRGHRGPAGLARRGRSGR